jgi:hypothetical protein
VQEKKLGVAQLWYATQIPAQETKIGVPELKYEISKLEISSS